VQHSTLIKEQSPGKFRIPSESLKPKSGLEATGRKKAA